MSPLKKAERSIRRLRSRYLKLSERRKRTLWVALALAAIALPAFLASPLGFQGGSNETAFSIKTPDQVEVGKTFTVELHVQTGGKEINAVSAVLHFDSRKLEILNMTTASSFCSFYAENSFDTIKGEVRLACGSPSPGFKGDSALALINVRSKAVGSANITLSRPDSHILANDGKGTDIMGPVPSATVTINQSL